MPSSSEPTAAPLYLELAPAEGAKAQVEHLYVLRDHGWLTGCGSGRFATDLFTLSVMLGGEDGRGTRVALVPPRPEFTPRRASFGGVTAGLRLVSRPECFPPPAAFEPLNRILRQVRMGNDDLPLLVAALDGLASDLSFAALRRCSSERTERRRIRADTGISRRRLAATRRFRQLLGAFAGQGQRLSELALEAGYYDQAHMSAACRVFAGSSAGALYSQAGRQPLGRFLQDERLKARLRLAIDG